MAKIASSQERLNQLFDADPRTDIAIANSLGISKQTISAWRNGTRSPKRTMVKTIAQYYNCSEEWLYGWDMPAPAILDLRSSEKPVPDKEDEQMKEIISLILQFSPEKKAEAVRYLRYLSKSEENV